MLTRRRCPCSNRATARPTGPTYGPMPRAPSRTPRWSSTTSANRARAGMPAASSGGGGGGGHGRRFVGDWRCSLTCDDFSGYKALIASGVTEGGCLAHARRKFFDLHAANQSQIAELALQQFGRIYEIEHEVKELATDQRQAIRQQQTKPLLDALHQWMVLQRQKVPEGSASAKGLDYSLRRWVALTRFVDDGPLPVDNNWIENQIRPIAIGRNTWLFAGSRRAGQRAAAVMSLIQSAGINGHDPYAYLRDVMARLPMQRASQIGELLPHRWQPACQSILRNTTASCGQDGIAARLRISGRRTGCPHLRRRISWLPLRRLLTPTSPLINSQTSFTTLHSWSMTLIQRTCFDQSTKTVPYLDFQRSGTST